MNKSRFSRRQRWVPQDLGWLQTWCVTLCLHPHPAEPRIIVSVTDVFWQERKAIAHQAGDRRSNRHRPITLQPGLPNLSHPSTSCFQAQSHLCSSTLGAAADGLSLLPPKFSLLARARPYQERPISPLTWAGKGQATRDTSRDSSLILAKLLQSPAAHTQTRLFQRLIKLKQPWSDPYGNGNKPIFSTKHIFLIGFQVPVSKYGSIRSFQRKDFLNYSNTAKTMYSSLPWLSQAVEVLGWNCLKKKENARVMT